MSKQHLADMLKSITTGDMEAAKAHFSKYSTEKSQEILSRGDQPEESTVEEPVTEPSTPEPEAVVPDEPAVEPSTDVTED